MAAAGRVGAAALPELACTAQGRLLRGQRKLRKSSVAVDRCVAIDIAREGKLLRRVHKGRGGDKWQTKESGYLTKVEASSCRRQSSPSEPPPTNVGGSGVRCSPMSTPLARETAQDTQATLAWCLQDAAASRCLGVRHRRAQECTFSDGTDPGRPLSLTGVVSSPAKRKMKKRTLPKMKKPHLCNLPNLGVNI
jgi:hypothetical protein